jgi:hypothetical protein
VRTGGSNVNAAILVDFPESDCDKTTITSSVLDLAFAELKHTKEVRLAQVDVSQEYCDKRADGVRSISPKFKPASDTACDTPKMMFDGIFESKGASNVTIVRRLVPATAFIVTTDSGLG